MSDDNCSLIPPPSIPGLGFRHFRGESDFPKMTKAIEASYEIDKIDHVSTVEDLANTYSHFENCDPYTDIIIAEINGELIGYSRGDWNIEESSGNYLYYFGGFLVPAWRRKGIGSTMLGWIENRLREIASGHPSDKPHFFQVYLSQFETTRKIMLEKSGYQPIRYFHEMLRPSLDDIKDFTLPEGIEIRPVLPEHYRLVWDALFESFHDHWGFSEPKESDYQGWLNDKSTFQPDLWQVAWDVSTNQVAGHILTFINQTENDKFNRKRGYTESIGVRRPWRKRGLAHSMITHSLRKQKELGMTESALNVDTENLSGATRIYEECGFQIVKTNPIYRKPL